MKSAGTAALSLLFPILIRGEEGEDGKSLLAGEIISLLLTEGRGGNYVQYARVRRRT
jgi:hypothetical protein